MGAGHTRDVDDDSDIVVFDPEIGRCFPNQPEGGSVVNGNYRLPLLVGQLMNNTIPGKPCVVYNDMNFALTKFSGFRDEILKINWIRYIAWDEDGATRERSADFIGNSAALFAVDIAYHNFGAFISKEPRSFSTDSLT